MLGGTFHKLKRNHGTEGPENVVCVICESKPCGESRNSGGYIDGLEFSRGSAIGIRRKAGRWSGKEQLEFADHSVFWSWLRKWSRKKSPVWLYGCNWSDQSQLLCLWDQFDRDTFKLEIPPDERKDNAVSDATSIRRWSGLACIDNKPFIVTCVGPTGTVKICDIRNYLPDCDMDKLDCVAGCNALHTLIVGVIGQWQKDNRGTWQATSGKLAMSNYRHRFLDERLVIHKPKLDKGVSLESVKGLEEARKQDVFKSKELEREAFIGGEVRNWFRGEDSQTVYHVDITGHYAAIMRDEVVPYKLLDYREGDNCHDLGEKYGWGNCVADARVNTFEDFYPNKTGDKVRWRIGAFNTVLCGKELQYAIENGAIQSVARISAFAADRILRPFAEFWIQERRRCKDSGNLSGETLAKMMLVSLPGKFGALGNKWKMRPGSYCPVKWGSWVQMDATLGQFCEYRAIGGSAQCSGKRGEKLDSFVGISAFITSAGRHKIRQLRLTLPPESVYLQQTDSLLLTEQGYERCKEWAGFGSGESGTARCVATYGGVNIWNANQWEAGTQETGEATHRCLAGIATDRSPCGPTEWRVREAVCSGTAVRSGPSRTVERRERIVSVGADGGQYGHWGLGWANQPLTEAEINRLAVGDLGGSDSWDDIESLRVAQKLLFG